MWTTGLFAAVLLALAIVDLKRRRVPNAIVLPATVLALAVAAGDGRLLSATAGATAGGLLFLALFALGRRRYGPGALGMGDVKLAVFIGAVVGVEWVGVTLPLGMLLAGGAATVLLLSGRARRGDSLPYGQFLALAAVITLFIMT